jgi:hypothetical protein
MMLSFSSWLKTQEGVSRPLARPAALCVYPLLYLLPLGLIFHLTGYLPPYLRLFLIYFLFGLPLVVYPSAQTARGALILLGLMVVEAWIPLPPPADIALLLIGQVCIWSRVTRMPAGINAGLCFYSLLHFYLFLSPLGHPLVEAMTRSGVKAVGWVTGSAFNLGPTYLNLGGFLLFLCLSVASWDRTVRSKARTGSYLLVACLVSSFLSAVLLRKVDFGAEMVWQLKFRDVFSYPQLFGKLRGVILLVYPLAVYLAGTIVYLVLHYEAWRVQPAINPQATSSQWSWRSTFGNAKALALLGVTIALLLVIMPPTAGRRPAVTSLVFVERGVVSFTKPDYLRYGRAAGGMYGLFPDYAGLFGCKAVVVKDVPETLDTDQVLVLTNLDEPTKPEVFRRIWDFVARGGKLWVLGDHTFIKNGRNHINDLLAPCHISLNHDSAQFFPQGWFHSYQFLAGTPFAGLSDPAENRPAILVGASLEVRTPALPLILGRYGYSDWGTSTDVEQKGYIGDFKYQSNERLGDLVLVAGEKYGKGKVLVFGDTTSFFNNNLSRSYELLQCVLSWFGESPNWLGFTAWPMRLIAGLLLVALGGMLFIVPPISSVPGVLAAIMLVSWLGQRATGLLPWNYQYARSHLAMLDFAHEPYTSKHSGMDSGLHGLSINFARYGLLPVAANEWDPNLIMMSDVMVLNAPRRPFTSRERQHLMRYLEQGGTVWLACGYHHYPNCKSLLDPLQVRVLGVPLGRFFDRTAFGQRVSFVSAWPIEVNHPDASVITFYDQWPLIVLIPVGKGRLVLIGDSEFLHNRNVEGFENYDPATIQFIKALLDYTVGGRGT